MLANGTMRASDQDRESAVAMLRDAYADGRLDLSELSDRAGAAYRARTWDDLRRLTADLPARAGFPRSRGAAARVPKDFHEALRRTLAPVLPVWLAWLAIAAGVFVPAAVVPLFVLSMAALLAVCWATRHKGTCESKRLVRGEQHSATADSRLACGGQGGGPGQPVRLNYVTARDVRTSQH